MSTIRITDQLPRSVQNIILGTTNNTMRQGAVLIDTGAIASVAAQHHFEYLTTFRYRIYEQTIHRFLFQSTENIYRSTEYDM
eukprot:2657636-Amphidinium_carterae.4